MSLFIWLIVDQTLEILYLSALEKILDFPVTWGELMLESHNQ